jgi:hypothetical protein
VETLGASGVADLYAYLNFDMLGSPNYVRFVFDGDGSDTEPAGPPGSGELNPDGRLGKQLRLAARHGRDPIDVGEVAHDGPT